MALFDSVLEKVWQIAREEQQKQGRKNEDIAKDFLNKFATLTTDRARVESVLALPPLQLLKVTDGFSQKCNSLAEDLKLQGDNLYEQNAAKSEEALQLYSSAIRLAPPESSMLARCYSSRSRALWSQGSLEEAVKDAGRALAMQSLDTLETVRILILIACCHADQGEWQAGEDKLNHALEHVRNSKTVSNEEKAQLALELSSQLKDLGRKRKETKGKSKRRGHNSVKRDPTSETCDYTATGALPELTFGKNTNFPSASSALQLNESKEKGNFMTASRNIKIGSVLIVEGPYAWSLTRDAMAEHCLHCCRRAQTPVPCSLCSTVIYCGEDCKEEAWNKYHRYECSVLDHILNSKELSRMALLVYRIAITALSSGQETSMPLNETGQGRILLLPLTSEAYNSVYRQVTNSEYRTPADVLKRAVSAVFLTRCLTQAGFPLSDEVIAATIMLRHLQSCSCNAYQITEQTVPGGNVREAEGAEIGGAVYPTISLCNHGCNPNVVRHSHGKVCIVRAIRPIKKGEEILDNYGPHYLADPLEERQRFLQTQYFFKCKCDACFSAWPLVKELQTKVNQFKCMHCAALIENEISNLKSCPKCKKKLDYSRTCKKLKALENDYRNALDHLLKRRFHKCLKSCIEYAETLDTVTIHPNKEFVKCQQAIILCWNLIGNSVEK